MCKKLQQQKRTVNKNTLQSFRAATGRHKVQSDGTGKPIKKQTGKKEKSVHELAKKIKQKIKQQKARRAMKDAMRKV